ncbi:hypothetical protein [Entomohabitans teleogrylli]|uniref:hypothetical protein n=1 Tax=Entomohabitans teleogrylli TaxID=1384589 RepID=UPI00073D4A2E|nr:hypothetical protein [Entomohabitans teleogrylli]
MSKTASWCYTKNATFWKNLGFNESGDPLGFAEPVIIKCLYKSATAAKQDAVGVEITTTITFWTEFSGARRGDYMMPGISMDQDPVAAGADEVMSVDLDASAFDSSPDDYTIKTGR